MAKKEVKVSDVFANLDGIDPFGTSDLENSDIGRILEYIDMGSWMLNAAVSGSIKKGWPNNKILQLAGESGAGKSFIAIMMCKYAQKLGYSVVYLDTEGAIDTETLMNFGVDLGSREIDGVQTPMFRYTPVSEAGDLIKMLTQTVKSLKTAKSKKNKMPKIFFVLDSIGMIASTKEVNDSMAGKNASDMGQRAKNIKSLFRQITSDLNIIGCPFLYTNHVGVNISGYGDATIIAGGEGAKYSASATLCLSKAKLKDDKQDDKKQTGIIVTAKTNKCRFAQPKDFKFHIRFDKPFNRYLGCQDYISWDNVGIAKGNVLTDSEFKKLSATDKAKVKFVDTVVEVKGEPTTKTLNFLPKDSARKWMVSHLGEMIETRDLMTERVMEPLVDKFDELIRADFEFSSQGVEEEIDALLDEVDSEE